MADILSYEPVLPADFDGTFRFTNWTDEEFVGKWGSKEYHFPPNSTSPILMPNQTPLEIQSIRKKFAKDLAEREFFKSQKYGKLINQERNPDGSARLPGIHGAGTYSLDDLVPMIQKCLEPLPSTQAKVVQGESFPLMDKLHKDEEGEPVTQAIDKKISLKKKALEG